ncbi:MAG: glucosyl-3-phosphoglycerate synthase [Anaerolineae bacterium]|nr:glucosyl-3-phosphoglycerate synthase [Anaerolineae bacterium]
MMKMFSQKSRARSVKRIFTPFPNVVIPMPMGTEAKTALSMASRMGGAVSLVGLISVKDEVRLSTGATLAREFRRELVSLNQNYNLTGSTQVMVSVDRWGDLLTFLKTHKPDLVILEYPDFFEAMGISTYQAAQELEYNVAIVRGPWMQNIERILIPVRGGPYAELALRIGLALHAKDNHVLHLTSPDTQPTMLEAPFRGLARILPRLSEVRYERQVSTNPAEAILQQAKNCDLLVAGIAASTQLPSGSLGTVAETLFNQSPCALALVKTERSAPLQFTGVEGEQAGAQAISVLVDKWFAENTYHADEFDDLERMVALKKAQGLTISLALPALNEEATIGQIIQSVTDTLVKQYPLLDEIVLIDSNSTDTTRQIAKQLGIPVYIHQELLPNYGARSGKGEALWKSLYVTKGDLIIWIDTDIQNIQPHFVYGVIGPMLVNPQIQFVKGFYQRPLKSGELTQSTGGGRVTELTARPLINLFYPELSGVIQPLAGEYGGRRTALEQLPFFSGYGVETGLLIDVFEKFGLSAIAQVDLLERIHRNQSLEALGKMSFVVLQAVLRKLEKRFNRPILEEVNKTMKIIRHEEGNYFLQVVEVAERERPPMIEIKEYIDSHKR